ncbi:sialoadhesin-like isoform X2 [Puntigrus tetrazona]|nr:sialoadhesin-like isoform X2 [Puntigrus tetrazona]XP_043109282.1 sialoadhesin-like isoform X2 [Puntigrus tetrazona]
MDFRITSLILLLHVSESLTLKPIFVSCESICALRETQARLKCNYDNIHTKTAFWFSEKQSKNWRKNNEPEDLTLDSDYSGRVEQTISKYEAMLIISDVTETDAGEYQLMFVDDGVKHLSSAAVNLTVTDLQVRIGPASTDPRNETVELTCEASCDLMFSNKNYYWNKNNIPLPEANSRSIVVSPEAPGSYSCSRTPGLSSSPVCVSQSSCWDVTYTSRRVCAVVGSTVEISSTYSHPPGHTVRKTFWHYGPSGDSKDLHKEPQFSGRVEYVENKLRIKDLKISDSGEYRFMLFTDLNGRYIGSPGVTLTVTDTQVTRIPNFVFKRQEVTLICSTKCTLTDKHTCIWYKNGRQVTDGFTKDNKLYLDSVSSEELQQYSCALEVNVKSTAFSHYTVTLLVFLPQFLIIAALWI